jgi:primosomal protein N'
MGLLDAIDKLITERGSAAVMDKHLAFVREQASSLEKQVAALQNENRTLKETVAKLQRELSSKMAAEEFVEHRGALFKPKVGGGYHQAVYCPRCRGPMSSLLGEIPYRCQPCKVSVDFTGKELTKVMSDLP